MTKTFYVVWADSMYIGTFSSEDKAQSWLETNTGHPTFYEIRPTPLCPPKHGVEHTKFYHELDNPAW